MFSDFDYHFTSGSAKKSHNDLLNGRDAKPLDQDVKSLAFQPKKVPANYPSVTFMYECGAVRRQATSSKSNMGTK